VLPDHECGPPARDAKHQPQGAKIAILDPELILLNVLEHLREQATLLGMAILIEKHVGNQHALLIENHQGLARQGGRPGGAQFLEAMLG
jgi:hypothetical protein